MAKSEPTNIYPVHVICCNDAIISVVIGTEEQVLAKLEVEALADWEHRYKWEYQYYKEYRNRLHWNLHTVNGEAYEPL